MILILGSGRSGTTFLAKLFDSHPAVLYRHEPDSVVADHSIPFQPRLRELDRYKGDAAAYLDRLARVRTPKASAHLPFFPKHYRGMIRQKLHGGFAFGAKMLSRLPGFERRVNVPDLIDPAAADPVIVIKSVNSLNRARLFLEARPDLRIVHIVRHPCGVVASQIRGVEQRLMNNDIFLDSLYRMENVETYGLPRDTIERRSLEEKIAFQWMVTNDRVLNEMTGKAGYRMVRYEDLCLDTAAVIDELFSFCGLGKNPQTDSFVQHLEGRQSGNATYFSVMRSPKKAAFKWKDELSVDQVARVLDITGHSGIGALYPPGDGCSAFRH